MVDIYASPAGDFLHGCLGWIREDARSAYSNRRAKSKHSSHRCMSYNTPFQIPARRAGVGFGASKAPPSLAFVMISSFRLACLHAFIAPYDLLFMTAAPPGPPPQGVL